MASQKSHCRDPTGLSSQICNETGYKCISHTSALSVKLSRLSLSLCIQDSIEPFSTEEAHAIVEEDLGAPVKELFSEFSAEPIGAASLAQVYRARLATTGEEVAVKVQRPSALATISKDLYVLRRGVGVYEAIVKRFTAQTTDYQQLLSTFAEGLYTEMDFRNEALNQRRMRALLDDFEYTEAEVVIPEPNMQLTTRRVLVMEWISGEKLTLLPKDEINTLVKTGQEMFLIQLLEIGEPL